MEVWISLTYSKSVALFALLNEAVSIGHNAYWETKAIMPSQLFFFTIKINN